MDQKTLVEQLQGRSEFIENHIGASTTLGDLRDAFGDKYLLNFGDDFNDFSYRVIIKERGYTGAVLPMVGGADPVVLQWESDDDFYQPIKGSKCTINLMVTDSVNYDDFYQQPENTYKVLLQWYGYDGTGTGPSTWNTFWAGWLVSDNFKELVSTTPYPITLTATDGLGALDGYTINPAEYRPQFASQNSYPLQIELIADILQNIDLKLDIIATHEWVTYQRQTLTANTAAFDSFLFNGKSLNTKEILEAILLSTNSRIFQADNRWCIIPNSCYDPTQFSNNISSLTQFLGYQPTDIRSQKTTYLVSQNAEVIEFEKFNPSGSYIGTESRDAHIAMPADVQNIGNDLVVEYLPAYKEVSINYDVQSYNKRKYQLNPNQFFSYGNTGYNISEGFIGQYEYSLEDSIYSYRGLQGSTSPTVYPEMIRTTLPQTTDNGLAKIKTKLNIQYLYDTETEFITRIDFTFRYSIKILDNLNRIQYYDADNEVWVINTPQYIEVESDYINYNNIWESTELEFNLPSALYQTLEVIIYRPYIGFISGYQGMYIGQISLQGVDEAEQQIHNYKSVQADNSNVYEQERTSVEHITGMNVFGQTEVPNGVVAQRPRDNYATWVPTNRSQVINREIMNDFRTPMHRYEGTIKNNHYKPISLLNRLWINFGTSVMQLPDSCMIDSLETSLKRNAYKVNMHLPNNDSDQLAVETNQFKK